MANETDNRENTVVFLIAPGDMLEDRWLIETRIGQGAMGSVFKGRDTKQNKTVAIKILAPEHCRKPKVLARFEREAKLMTTLRHPNIIQISGVGRRGALPYIVMQYLEGMTLYDVLKHKGGKLTAGETMAVVKQISAGLAFIHHHGLVHRDVKPQNVFVGPGGHVTILDLGVVRDKSNPGLTKPGAMVGTPYYMSPEQITGTEEIDKRTDVYALAAMTFELLVGKPPFQGTSNFEVLYAHRTQPAPDASLIAKNVSKDAAKALMRGMAKTREERPQSATEFYGDLEAFFGQSEKIDPKVAFAFLEVEAEKLRQKEKEKAARKDRERVTRIGSQPNALAVKSTRATTQLMLRAAETKDGPRPIHRTRTQPGGPPSAEVPMARSGDVEFLDPSDTTNAVRIKESPNDTSYDDEALPETGIETEAINTSAVDGPGVTRDEGAADEVEGEGEVDEDDAVMRRARKAARSADEGSFTPPSRKASPSVDEESFTPPNVRRQAKSAGEASFAPPNLRRSARSADEESFTNLVLRKPARSADEESITPVPKANKNLPADPSSHPTGFMPIGADPESTVMESGELRVITTIKGLTTSCQLFIDEKLAGSTPSSLQVPEGPHQVRVERAGFKPMERSVMVKSNEVTLIRIELQTPPR